MWEGTGDAPVNLTADEGESGAEGSIGPASATEGEEEAVRVQRPHRTLELDPDFEAEMAALEAQYQNRSSHSGHDAHSAVGSPSPVVNALEIWLHDTALSSSVAILADAAFSGRNTDKPSPSYYTLHFWRYRCCSLAKICM